VGRGICSIEGEEMVTILIRCSDPRINKVIDEVLNLGKEHAIIANTGSIKYFLVRDKLSNLADQINILAKGFGANKIIVTNHTDCGFYKQLGQNEEIHYSSDLKHTRKFILKAFPQIKVECYLIDTKRGTKASV
jgi:carbonic anhydrase